MSDKQHLCSVLGCDGVTVFSLTLKGATISTHAELCSVHGRALIRLTWAMIQESPPAFSEPVDVEEEG